LMMFHTYRWTYSSQEVAHARAKIIHRTCVGGAASVVNADGKMVRESGDTRVRGVNAERLF
jgi:hypothetical protein